MGREINMTVLDRFVDVILDWDYETYLLLGGYGSGKSYSVAQKIVLKCLEEKRKVLVVRETYSTIQESCFAVLKEVLEGMNLLEAGSTNHTKYSTKVQERKSPLEFTFPNGSRIIFRGMDSPAKFKSIHGVSIVWLEECSEIKYDGYKELLGRLRTSDVSMHFILSSNPVGFESWVYSHFFKYTDENGLDRVIVDEERMYELGTIVNNKTYYHHSKPEDNIHLPHQYINRLDEIRRYDYQLWRVARLGKFGAAGTLVLPQLEIANSASRFRAAINRIPERHKFNGMDFGFEESYNAIVRMAVDDKNEYLYIYDEYYQNKETDDILAKNIKKRKWDDIGLIADNEDPKAIAYLRGKGIKIRGCRGKNRLSNTRKVKRFKKIIVSPKCRNTIRELRTLTYKVDRNGNAIYDEFNIDPHTLSAIWYGLDRYNMTDLKRTYHSRKGA